MRVETVLPPLAEPRKSTAPKIDLTCGAGAELKRVREALRMSQAQIADAVGMARTSITNIERGQQRLSLMTLKAIADALGMDVVVHLKPKAAAVCPECNGAGEFESALHSEKCAACGGSGSAGSGGVPELPKASDGADTYWMVERGPNQGEQHHYWWDGTGPRGGNWTRDSRLGSRFAKKEDAEFLVRSLRNCEATEHMDVPFAVGVNSPDGAKR